MQTILGANGTIGSLLAKDLRNYTDRIRLVSRNPKRINYSDELFPADLSNSEVVDKAVEGSDVVYLVVGFDYKTEVWQKKWPKLMRATIDACIKYKARLVFFDNVYMYAIDAIPHMTEESKINPPSRKGEVRRQIVQMIMDEVKAGRLMALIARSADFYGPNNEKSFINEMVIKNLRKGKSADWLLDTDKKHSFTFTPDAARATAILGNTDHAYNQVWHLPTDSNALTGREFVALFAKELNAKPKVRPMHMWLLKILGFFIPVMKEIQEMSYQYDRDYFFDSSKFDRKFNFKTTTYGEGVKECLK
jgi:nucleoside-diphosphate-sugar epimerase